MPQDGKFSVHENLPNIVNVQDCFDNLLVNPDHELRLQQHTYYWDSEHVLRTHMTTHDIDLIKKGHNSFISIGDVYRRDTIDNTHYPIFHQVDGVRLFNKNELLVNPYDSSRNDPYEIAMDDLKYVLLMLIRTIFGEVEAKWVDTYFPFTEPSVELEIFFNEQWLEVLGSGILRKKVIAKAGKDPEEVIGWAFGIGLERLAMKMFEIPDIRYFWSTDPRFLSQFKNNEITKFKPYSKFPACYKDISFYINDLFKENDLFEEIREVAKDLVESVELIDTFHNKKINRISNCYRILYRHMDRNLTNEEIDVYQFKIRDIVSSKLKLELR